MCPLGFLDRWYTKVKWRDWVLVDCAAAYARKHGLPPPTSSPGDSKAYEIWNTKQRYYLYIHSSPYNEMRITVEKMLAAGFPVLDYDPDAQQKPYVEIGNTEGEGSGGSRPC